MNVAERGVRDVVIRDGVDDKNEKRPLKKNCATNRRGSFVWYSERLMRTNREHQHRDATPDRLHETNVTNRPYITYQLRGEI